jgi:uncharacterized protein YndB with AHSA1/START domain
MPDILHRVGIKSPSPNGVYRALTTIDGLSDWWTSTTQGDSKTGGTVHFRFGDRGFFDMKVLQLDPAKRVLWEVVDGPAEWIGTTVSLELKQEGEQTTVLFGHRGWREQSEFMHHCSTKWASYLMSLKSLIEAGEGAPFPNDVRITVNWD